MPDDKQELKMTCPKCGQHVFCPTCLEEVDKQERSCERFPVGEPACYGRFNRDADECDDCMLDDMCYLKSICGARTRQPKGGGK